MATNNNASTHFQNRQKRSLLCMNCGTFQTLETGYLLWLCIQPNFQLSLKQTIHREGIPYLLPGNFLDNIVGLSTENRQVN